MKYFIGIVPPDLIYHSILNIQKQFGDNRLEPHITVRPPVELTDERSWINAIEKVCKALPPVEISLPATGNFDTRVLFVDVQSTYLNSLHKLLIAAIKPFEKISDYQNTNQPYHPHLTLGRSWCGFTKQDFKAMQLLAAEYLSAKPVSFTANSIRIYYKPMHQGRYEKLSDIHLTLNKA